jgi:tyrosyl-tRNA synthetase
MDDIRELETEIKNGGNPRDSKMRLARTIVAMYHSEMASHEAEANFIETFQKGGVPDDVLEIKPDYTEALLVHGIVASKTELRRLLEDGGVRSGVTGEKYESFPESVGEPTIVKIGKRRFVKLLP